MIESILYTLTNFPASRLTDLSCVFPFSSKKHGTILLKKKNLIHHIISCVKQLMEKSYVQDKVKTLQQASFLYELNLYDLFNFIPCPSLPHLYAICAILSLNTVCLNMLFLPLEILSTFISMLQRMALPSLIPFSFPSKCFSAFCSAQGLDHVID